MHAKRQAEHPSQPDGARARAHDRWGPAERTAFLATAPLFSRLPAATREVVANRFQVKRVPRGGFVFLDGEPARSLNVLAAGRVKVIRETEGGQEVILRLIQPGEMFGGAGGWGEAVYPASARALADALVLQLPAAEFARLIEEQGAFAAAVIQEMGQRLRVAEARIRELQTERVERRIARALLRLASRAGVSTAQGIEIRMPLTRQEVAELAGSTMTTASRTMSAWEQRGILAGGREHVVIRRPHDLVALAEDQPGALAAATQGKERPST